MMTLQDWPSILVTIAGLYLGPKIAVRLAIKQFHQQKLWEKRVEVYQQVIGDMSVLFQYYSEAFNATVQDIKGFPPLGAELQTALKALARHANAGGFIISKEAEASLSKVMTAVSTLYDSPQQRYDEVAGAFLTNIAILKECARRECNIAI